MPPREAVRSEKLAWRYELIWSGSGRMTNVPPVTPRTVVTRFWLDNTRKASRTVLRLTP